MVDIRTLNNRKTYLVTLCIIVVFGYFIYKFLQPDVVLSIPKKIHQGEQINLVLRNNQTIPITIQYSFPRFTIYNEKNEKLILNNIDHGLPMCENIIGTTCCDSDTKCGMDGEVLLTDFIINKKSRQNFEWNQSYFVEGEECNQPCLIRKKGFDPGVYRIQICYRKGKTTGYYKTDAERKCVSKDFTIVL